MNSKQIRPNLPADSSQKSKTSPTPKPSDTKEMVLLASGLLTLVLGIGGVLMYSEESEHSVTTASEDSSDNQFPLAPSFASHSASSNPTSKGHDLVLASTSVSLPPVKSLSTHPAKPKDSFPPSEIETPTEPKAQGTTVYFDVNQDTLTQDAKDTLTEHFQPMTPPEEGTLHVKGYTDSQGSSEYNRRLGLKRAQAVKTYLISLGYSEDQIIATSFGIDESVCQDQNQACFSKNRRVHIALVPPTNTPLPGSSDSPTAAVPGLSPQAEKQALLNPSAPEELSLQAALPEEIQEESIVLEMPKAGDPTP